MRRNELSPEAAAQLAVVDAILAGEPIGEEHLELAALVESIRGDAPRIDPGFHARLASSVKGRERARWRPQPRLALAGGSLFAAVVAVAVVLSSGVLNTRSTVVSNAVGSGTRAPHTRTLAPASSAAPSTDFSGAVAATGATTGPAPVTVAPNVQANTNPVGRLVAHEDSLTLTATPSRMQSVADQVVASTERLGGIVERSNVTVQGLASSASFSLSVPTTRLGALISALSGLSGVRSLNQSGTDITDSYDAAQARLSDERAQRRALITALAAASTLSEEAKIQQKINVLDAKIAAGEHHVGVLLTKGHNATVAVSVVATRASAGGGAFGGSGPVGSALRDSLRVLDVALAIALVAFAIMLPLALCGLAVWWSGATLRQRARERAFEGTRG